jgi:hypothetical protein
MFEEVRDLDNMDEEQSIELLSDGNQEDSD